ncbi:hypothetical protein D9615_000836 [Tricholomella constricta]|uniref:Uncharacterized protein n=1 Tax=Tricholomella constricta TaxID=117010 RepID=A0A8H5HQZ9_9AGAR|nr:hypothetical protein D9615_000836 [Tricholomella constricta]
MALNWTMLGPDRSPVPLPNEMTITTISSSVELSLTIPDATPTGNSTAGRGSLINECGLPPFLSTSRLPVDPTFPRSALIFTGDAGAPFESLSVPLHAILSTKFEQPTFGANYLSFDVKPSSAGGLTEGTKAELRFRDRAMFEFVSLLEKTRERAIYMKRQAAADEEEGLPIYTSPAESSSVSLSMGVPIDNPPGYNV